MHASEPETWYLVPGTWSCYDGHGPDMCMRTSMSAETNTAGLWYRPAEKCRNPIQYKTPFKRFNIRGGQFRRHRHLHGHCD
jgi:hypothetical protein